MEFRTEIQNSRKDREPSVTLRCRWCKGPVTAERWAYSWYCDSACAHSDQTGYLAKVDTQKRSGDPYAEGVHARCAGVDPMKGYKETAEAITYLCRRYGWNTAGCKTTGQRYQRLLDLIEGDDDDESRDIIRSLNAAVLKDMRRQHKKGWRSVILNDYLKRRRA